MIPRRLPQFSGRYLVSGLADDVRQAVSHLQKRADQLQMPFHAMTTDLQLSGPSENGRSQVYVNTQEFQYLLGPMDFVEVNDAVLAQLNITEREDGYWVYRNNHQKPIDTIEQVAEVFTGEDARLVKQHLLPFLVQRGFLTQRLQTIGILRNEHETALQETQEELSQQLKDQPLTLFGFMNLLNLQKIAILNTLNSLGEVTYHNDASPHLEDFARYLIHCKPFHDRPEGLSYRFVLKPELILKQFGPGLDCDYQADGQIRFVDALA